MDLNMSIQLETEVNITETAVQDDFEVEPGTLWTCAGDIFVLAQYKNSADGDMLYVAASIFDGRQWKEETTEPEYAVDGLDPFNGTVEITQTEVRNRE